ncbi:hypothetical protein [Pseudomonas guariconensis]|uniref:hypothetical protein n=1 Tax=Pseudomonas guariconensis TaxID=1288410 RepID=UPI002B052D55|nr:hypothetical protein [Pseudomonas guariconensis]
MLQQENTLRVSCKYQYDKEQKHYRFLVTVEGSGMSNPPVTETVVSRFELTQMKAFKGSHQKRAEQLAEALVNEKEVVLKTALRKCMAQIKAQSQSKETR